MTATPITALVVEDEKQMRRYITTLLETRDFHVLEASTTAEAISLAASHLPEVVLLDLTLADGEGYEVIAALREWSSVPILVISARDQEDAKIRALDAGADDYLTKPFGAGELLARIRVALRHARQMLPETPEEPVFISGALRVDLNRRLVFLHDQEVDLTPTEYRLLAYLIQNAGRVLTHRQILREVWGPDAVDRTHYARIFMANLRKKLEADPARPTMLITETGVGYRFKPANQ